MWITLIGIFLMLAGAITMRFFDIERIKIMIIFFVVGLIISIIGIPFFIIDNNNKKMATKLEIAAKNRITTEQQLIKAKKVAQKRGTTRRQKNMCNR